MKRIALILSLTALPAFAEEPSTPTPDMEEGASLMQEGAKLLLRGLIGQMEPAMDDMAQALSEMEPYLKDLPPKLMELMALIDDVQNYDGPIKLENGDILIRRKTAEELERERAIPETGPQDTSPAPPPEIDL